MYNNNNSDDTSFMYIDENLFLTAQLCFYKAHNAKIVSPLHTYIKNNTEQREWHRLRNRTPLQSDLLGPTVINEFTADRVI